MQAQQTGFAVATARGGIREKDVRNGILCELAASAGVRDISGQAGSHAWLTEMTPKASRGLLIAVDEAQWADEPSLRVLGRLWHLPVTVALTIRGNQRPEVSPALLDLEEMADTVALGNLNAISAESLLRSRLPKTPSSRFCDQAHTATGGNPALLAQLAAVSTETGMEPGDDAVESLVRYHPRACARPLVTRISSEGELSVAVCRELTRMKNPDTAMLARRMGVTEAEAVRTVGGLAQMGVVSAGARITLRYPVVGAAFTRTEKQRTEKREGAGLPFGQKLSPHQMRIARLAVKGWKNREIADCFGVSTRAVEFQMTDVYRRLGITRRAQLALALPGDYGSTRPE
ncbi:LuxR C-terminal-related transcriptional regulator [Streptomyces sp. NPDC054796]